MRTAGIILLGLSVAMAAPSSTSQQSGADPMTVGQYAQAVAADPSVAQAVQSYHAGGGSQSDGKSAYGGEAGDSQDEESDAQETEMPTGMEVKEHGKDEASDKNWDSGATMEESYENDSGPSSSEEDGSYEDGGDSYGDGGSGEDGGDSYGDDNSSDSSDQGGDSSMSGMKGGDRKGGKTGSMDGGSGSMASSKNSSMTYGSGSVNSTTAGGASSSSNSTKSSTNSTVASAGAGASHQVTISPEGYTPKDMTVKKGDMVTFTLKGAGPYSVTQSSNATSCSPLSGGFDSKMLSGVGTTWNWTVPANAPSKVYVYSSGAGQCQNMKMTAAFSVTDNLVSGGSNSTASSPSSPPASVGSTSQANAADSAASSVLSTSAVILGTLLALATSTFHF